MSLTSIYTYTAGIIKTEHMRKKFPCVHLPVHPLPSAWPQATTDWLSVIMN